MEEGKMITIVPTTVEANITTNFTKYRRTISVQNNESIDLNDYQVCIEIADIDFIVKADPDNLVLQDGNIVLPYWVESWKRPDGIARIWTKLSLPASSTKQITLYYGGCVSWVHQNGDNVFEFFDDFDEDSLNSSKWQDQVGTYLTHPSNVKLVRETQTGLIRNNQSWNTGYNFVSRVKFITSPADETYIYMAVFDDWDGYWHDVQVAKTNTENDNGCRHRVRGGGSFIKDELYKMDMYEFVNLKLQWYDTTSRGFFRRFLLDSDYIEIGSPVTNFTSNPLTHLQIAMYANADDGGSASVDFVYVTKYTTNEPTITVNTEQQQNVSW